MSGRGLMDTAASIVEEMASRSVLPSSNTMRSIVRGMTRQGMYQRAIQIGLAATRLSKNPSETLGGNQGTALTGVTVSILQSLSAKLEAEYAKWAEDHGMPSSLLASISSGAVQRIGGLPLGVSPTKQSSEGPSKPVQLVLSPKGALVAKEIHDRRQNNRDNTQLSMLRSGPQHRRSVQPQAGDEVCDASSLRLVGGALQEILLRSSYDDLRAGNEFVEATMRAYIAQGLPLEAIASFEISLGTPEPPSPGMVRLLARACSAAGTPSPIIHAARQFLLPALACFSDKAGDLGAVAIAAHSDLGSASASPATRTDSKRSMEDLDQVRTNIDNPWLPSRSVVRSQDGWNTEDVVIPI